MLWPMVSLPVCHGFRHPSGAHDQIFPSGAHDQILCQLWICCCGVLCLMRGQVCCLQLLLVLASTVILGSGSRETHSHNLLSQIRASPNLEGQVLISPGSGWPSYNPGHCDHQSERQFCWLSLYSLGMDHRQNIPSNNSSIVAFTATDMCLMCRCLAMATIIPSTIPAFSHHYSILLYYCKGISRQFFQARACR
jgi:hypothetical protein